ncbi:hypothetical protein [Pseudomonas sp. 5P_3.1_Bac2]|uniref:hypothetical protein n=1 Tax=Pseudomonas sp. 5P_3.1_Bac2 TaxID=2971617 RepID=UPI0021C711E5|nr:hypothetical protein [Pseudomonas sp. 5P_3.1_Bac2]MCU1717942.1 hypothetical protein [Pseudomonas sp. 5P_3.1_Bac2]
MTDKDGFISVVHEKANLSARAEPVSVEFKQGIPMPSGAGAGSDGITQALFDQVSIVRVLKVAHKADITVPAVMSGPSTALHVLEAFPEYPSELKRNRTGKERARAAITAFKREGRLVVDTFKTPSRNTRERLVLTELADLLCDSA